MSRDHDVHARPRNEMMELANCEEADTRIIVHLVNAFQTFNSIQVQIGDINVIVVIMGQFQCILS